jgi:hypothetical protein
MVRSKVYNFRANGKPYRCRCKLVTMKKPKAKVKKTQKGNAKKKQKAKGKQKSKVKARESGTLGRAQSKGTGNKLNKKERAIIKLMAATGLNWDEMTGDLKRCRHGTAIPGCLEPG